MLYNNDICQNFPDYDPRNRLRANSPEGSKFFLLIGGTKITFKNVKKAIRKQHCYFNL